jgi:superfamily I DNA/RNA helicase
MTTLSLKARQKTDRQKCLEAILSSKAQRKVIVAGPGTGKTFTFRELLKQNAEGTNLAMTFIRRLVEDLESELADCAEVKTFHAYCKKILHDKRGRVELVPYLSKIVQRDAECLGRNLKDFDVKLRLLEEDSKEVKFYLRRGNYYKVVGFDDSVYRLYRLLLKEPDIVPNFDQIVIDEFQDFNPLEVAFIRELEKKGPILIVGDDDQAVYEGRAASATHLRNLYKSGRYKVFELPYCSRCPKVIVDATNALLSNAKARGYLRGRIAKRYECYLETKEEDSKKYPKLVIAECTTGRIVPKYVQQEITSIDANDIIESHKQGYPTVLIVGPRQYLREAEQQLGKIYSNLSYTRPSEMEYGIADAYELLLRDKESNLGWRILLELFYPPDRQKEILFKTTDGRPMIDLLENQFVQRHVDAIKVVQQIKHDDIVTPKQQRVLKKAAGNSTAEVVEHFSPSDEEEDRAVDDDEPSILLTSYVGSKGLSAGHVFVIGAHNGSMPRDPKQIKDIEISQFLVALTRTRKQCHVISNQWLISPKNKHGQWLTRNEKSTFVSWIPKNLIEDRGTLKASTFKQRREFKEYAPS